MAILALFCARDTRVRQHKRIDVTDEKMLRQRGNLAVPLQKCRLTRVGKLTEAEISGLDCISIERKLKGLSVDIKIKSVGQNMEKLCLFEVHYCPDGHFEKIGLKD